MGKKRTRSLIFTPDVPLSGEKNIDFNPPDVKLIDFILPLSISLFLFSWVSIRGSVEGPLVRITQTLRKEKSSEESLVETTVRQRKKKKRKEKREREKYIYTHPTPQHAVIAKR
jgi:predicted Holliday junction resolvase-like endonuclease